LGDTCIGEKVELAVEETGGIINFMVTPCINNIEHFFNTN